MQGSFQVKVVSNSKNKIIATWKWPYIEALYTLFSLDYMAAALALRSLKKSLTKHLTQTAAPRCRRAHMIVYGVTCRLRLLRLALVLSADAGGARFVDIGASLEGVAGVDTRVVGEPLAALHFLNESIVFDFDRCFPSWKTERLS